jgi:hypothetical protein
VRLSGWRDAGGFKGKGQLPDGTWVSWSAVRTGDVAKKEEKAAEVPLDLGKVLYPFVAHGYSTLPPQQTLLIKNATVWTNEADGKLENTDVLLKDGKIQKIGKNLSDASAKTIDGTMLHLIQAWFA